MTTISIASHFSRYPGGRFRKDGPYSGEEFRDDLLIPALNKGESLVIEMDGVRGYGSSFLEEVFGGLVRLGHSRELLRQRLQISTSNPSLKLEINEYINDAQPSSGESH